MEAHSPLSIPLSITPTPSLMGDNQIQDFLIATGPDPASREEVELLSLIHTDPPGSSNLVNTEEPNENTTAISADDNGHLATGTDEAAMPNEMTAPAPSAFRPMFPWLSEGVCLVVAISALTATVVVLANFDKQEQPHWPYADIFNLSALIAILATLLRSMVTLILEACEYEFCPRQYCLYILIRKFDSNWTTKMVLVWTGPPGRSSTSLR